MLREETGGSDRIAAWSTVLRHDSSWVELRFLNCVCEREVGRILPTSHQPYTEGTFSQNKF